MISILRGITKFRLRRAFRLLKNRLLKLPDKLTVDSCMAFLLSREGSLIKPWQYDSEFRGFLTLYESLNSRHTLEIGTANGGTLFAHCKLAHPQATVISIDLPEGKFGGGYPEWKVPIYQAFAGAHRKLELIRASSHDNETVDRVKRILNGQQLDYLFIDGDHTYEGVRKDFELYAPLVRNGGLVIFHDIVPHPSSSCKVDVYWNEIKQKYRHREFINSPAQTEFGVGVIFYSK